MKTIRLLTLTIVLVAPLAGLHATDAPQEQPNILFILADDLGWGDLRCYGNSFIDTPVLDCVRRRERVI
jgi:hypothetical protein